MNAAVKGRSTQFLLPVARHLNRTHDKPPMTAKNDITPVFITDPDAPPGNVVPVLARLLIDMDRRQKLLKDGPVIMLKELSLDFVAPGVASSCPTQN
jgi:hypothetical protein